MNAVHLRNIDLNLLVVFDVIMKERSLVGASERLSLSQSAVSHALARLRKLIKDELFVREDNEMRPTRRALELALPVQHALGRIERALRAQEFEPGSSRRTFAMAASDYTCALIVPQLLARLMGVAPGVNLSVIPASRLDVIRQLEAGRIDLALAWFAVVPSRFGRETLITDTEVLMVRKGHPLTLGELTVERAMSYPHVVVDLIGNAEELVDGFLAERGVWRRVQLDRGATDAPRRVERRGRVVVKVPTFASALSIVAQSDMLASIPRRLAARMCSALELALLEPPFETPRITVEAIWHHRMRADPGLTWLRRELGLAAEDQK